MKKDKEKPKKKPLSDGEASNFAFKKLVGDLDTIEADSIFKKEEEKPGGDLPPGGAGDHSTTVKGPGYSVEVKHLPTVPAPRAEDKKKEEDDDQ